VTQNLLLDRQLPAGRAGVYYIVHRPTKATYVGMSTNCTSRLSKHRRDLRKGWHSNRPLQDLLNQSGMESLEFTVRWVAPPGTTEEEMAMVEHHAMNSVRQSGNPLLNVLLPPTKEGQAFSIGRGGRWKWSTARQASRLNGFAWDK
jgi:hypothetical protein